jgi:hypothetical protein
MDDINNTIHNWEHCGTIGRVAHLIGMTIDEWRTLAPLVPSWPDWLSLLQRALRHAGKTQTQLYCFDDIVLQLYEGTIATRVSSLYTHTTKERINGKNEVVDPSATLSANELRDICVLLEALVFKCVHIQLEGQSASYRE